MALRPLWGTSHAAFKDEILRPYFWGYGVDGERLPGLDDALRVVDGPGPKTEVDLFLMGPTQLILVEAKHTSGLGRCSRYGAGRCPEVRPDGAPDEAACRYWTEDHARFDADLEMVRPTVATAQPACNRHYQLARTFRLGRELSRGNGRAPSIWMFAPRTAWRRRLQRDWTDFADVVKDEAVWRRMRVIAWEDVRSLPAV
jgi:hypothetical protein